MHRLQSLNHMGRMASSTFGIAGDPAPDPVTNAFIVEDTKGGTAVDRTVDLSSGATNTGIWVAAIGGAHGTIGQANHFILNSVTGGTNITQRHTFRSSTTQDSISVYTFNIAGTPSASATFDWTKSGTHFRSSMAVYQISGNYDTDPANWTYTDVDTTATDVGTPGQNSATLFFGMGEDSTTPAGTLGPNYNSANEIANTDDTGIIQTEGQFWIRWRSNSRDVSDDSDLTSVNYDSAEIQDEGFNTNRTYGLYVNIPTAT